jgi:hypothetical protein
MTRAEIEAPVFLIGCGRSGTTLVYEILAEHPDLAWFSNYTERWPRVPQLALLSRVRELGALRGSESRFLPAPREGHALWDRCSHAAATVRNAPLTENDVVPEEARCARRLVLAHLRYHGKRRFINKNTRNARRVRYLNAIFPDALFIHVLRDPRATVASLLKVHFWPSLPIWWAGDSTPAELTAKGRDPVAVAAEFWSREVEQVVEDSAGLSPDRYLEIRYESFVDDPARALGSVLEFCRLTPSPLVDEALARHDVGSRNTKYRAQFDSRQLALIERVTARQAGRFGYDLAHAP